MKKMTAKSLHYRLRRAANRDNPLDPKLKARWVKALRSGKYKQGKDSLCQANQDGSSSFCCLGVLVNEQVDGYWELNKELDQYFIFGEDQLLPLSFDGLEYDVQTILAQANDAGLRFTTIAKAIEGCL